MVCTNYEGEIRSQCAYLTMKSCKCNHALALPGNKCFNWPSNFVSKGGILAAILETSGVLFSLVSLVKLIEFNPMLVPT